MEGVDESQCARASTEANRTRHKSPAIGRKSGLGLLLASAVALAAGVALRIFMLQRLFIVNGDSLIYGGIAKNLLLHGCYGLAAPNGAIYPTLIRLPGYPLFLAACFRIFGMENYWSAACVQIALELAGCLLLADFARLAARQLRGADKTFTRHAALATLWLAVLCPFTASYAALPLAEAPTLFLFALAMDAMAHFCQRSRWLSALAFTFGIASAALLRPDGALAAVAFAPVMLMAIARRRQIAFATQGAPVEGTRGEEQRDAWAGNQDAGKLDFRAKGQASLWPMAAACALLVLAAFAAWTWRNWRVFQVLEPLAPRLAVDPGEPTNPGWRRWVKTWCLDFISTDEIYWSVPDGPFPVDLLPGRAFDSPAQLAQTRALARAYEQNGEQLTPAIDAGFAQLAAVRIAAHPPRYYLWLPLGRLADMWLRPRIENLNVDDDWWVYAHHHSETGFGWFYAALNALYLALAALGLWLRPRYWKALCAYMLLRSALLLIVDAPETRYTLECFPMMVALGGIAIAAGLRKFSLARSRL